MTRCYSTPRKRCLLIVSLLVVGVACDKPGETGRGGESRGSQPQAAPECPLELPVTLSVTVSDAVTRQQLCDAEVSAVDERQLPLPFAPLAHGCSRLSYHGKEARLTVTAQKPGYSPASQQVVMKKRPCGYEAPPVYLQLQPLSTADNEAGSPTE